MKFEGNGRDGLQQNEGKNLLDFHPTGF